MNKLTSLFDMFRKPEQKGEAIDLTYGKLRIQRTVNQRESGFNFNETSVAVHRAIYQSLGLPPKV